MHWKHRLSVSHFEGILNSTNTNRNKLFVSICCIWKQLQHRKTTLRSNKQKDLNQRKTENTFCNPHIDMWLVVPCWSDSRLNLTFASYFDGLATSFGWPCADRYSQWFQSTLAMFVPIGWLLQHATAYHHHELPSLTGPTSISISLRFFGHGLTNNKKAFGI